MQRLLAASIAMLGCSITPPRPNMAKIAEEPVPANTTLWEYRCVPQLRWSAMNQVGADGWELVSYAPGGDGSDGCLKRPRPPATVTRWEYRCLPGVRWTQMSE